jgi:hypothetical protein
MAELLEEWRLDSATLSRLSTEARPLPGRVGSTASTASHPARRCRLRRLLPRHRDCGCHQDGATDAWRSCSGTWRELLDAGVGCCVRYRASGSNRGVGAVPSAFLVSAVRSAVLSWSCDGAWLREDLRQLRHRRKHAPFELRRGGRSFELTSCLRFPMERASAR